MDEVLHANIFFIIASVATVVFCILVSLALYQVLKILKIVRRISERIEEGSELIAEDAAAVRDFIRSGGLVSRLLGFIMNTRSGHSSARSRRRSDDD